MVSELIGVNNNGCISQGFPEKQNQQERQREGERGDREREVLFWELLTYTFMEAGKSHDLMSASS